MLNLLSATSILLAAASSVSGLTVARRSAPAGYASGYLEDYATYHTRYIALGCQGKHNTPFFDQCCHPMLATENLATSRPSQCTPTPEAHSSASAASPTSTVGTPADGEQECEDEDEDPAPPAAAAPSPSQEAPAAAANPTPAPAPSPDANPAPAAAPSPDANPAPATNAGNSQPAPSTSNGGDLIKGGFATFFDQHGIAGACGTVHQDSDLVAAMDSRRYGDTGRQSDLCGKRVEIHNPANGKSVTVVVADACPTCNNENSIDLSRGAFDMLADESVGIMPIEWRLLN